MDMATMDGNRTGNRRMLGNALLLLTAMIWGTAFVAQRAGMDYIEPITFCAARMVPAQVMEIQEQEAQAEAAAERLILTA